MRDATLGLTRTVGFEAGAIRPEMRCAALFDRPRLGAGRLPGAQLQGGPARQQAGVSCGPRSGPVAPLRKEALVATRVKRAWENLWGDRSLSPASLAGGFIADSPTLLTTWPAGPRDASNLSYSPLRPSAGHCCQPPIGHSVRFPGLNPDFQLPPLTRGVSTRAPYADPLASLPHRPMEDRNAT